jgi:hypothetical protein
MIGKSDIAMYGTRQNAATQTLQNQDSENCTQNDLALRTKVALKSAYSEETGCDYNPLYDKRQALNRDALLGSISNDTVCVSRIVDRFWM